MKRFKIRKEDTLVYHVTVPHEDAEAAKKAALETGILRQITSNKFVVDTEFTIYLSQLCEDNEVAQFASGDWLKEALGV